MDKFKQYIPTIIRASIFNVIFRMFTGKRGAMILVALLALYFINSEYNWINI